MTPADKAQLSEELSAYLDGELEPPRSLEVEALLTEAREVRDLLHEHRRVSQRLCALPRVTAPIDLGAMIHEQIQSIPPTVSPKRAFAGAARIHLGVTGAAAAILLLAFSFWDFEPVSRHAAPSPALTAADELGRVMSETDQPDDRQWAKVTPEELEALQGLGYVGGSEDDAVAFADVLDRMEPVGGRETSVVLSAAPSVGESTAATDQGEIPTLIAKASPELAGGSPTTPGPLIQVTVQPPSAASFRRALALAQTVEPTKKEQPTADRERRDYAGSASPDSISSLLRALDRESPDGVRITMNFALSEIAQAREILREPTAEPSPAPTASERLAGRAIRAGADQVMDAPTAQARKDIFFQRGAPPVGAGKPSASRAPTTSEGASVQRESNSPVADSDDQRHPLVAAARQRSVESTADNAGRGNLSRGPAPIVGDMAAQAQLLQPYVPGLLMPWIPPAPPALAAWGKESISLGITVLPPPVHQPASSRPTETPAKP